LEINEFRLPLAPIFGFAPSESLGDFLASPRSTERVPLVVVWTPEALGKVEGRLLR
jgi:hypothetical protein